MAKDPNRKNRMTRLSKLVDPMIEPSVRARGFVLSRLISEWPRIVGDVAGWCQPAELKFAQGETTNGILKLAIASGRGPEATQQRDTIISRVNAAFGYAAVSRISLVQKLQPSPPEPQPHASNATANPDNSAHNAGIWALDEKLQSVRSPEVRAALRRLGTPLDE